MKRLSILIGLAVFLLGAATMPDENAQAPAATRPVAVNIADKQALEANFGKDVVVEGTVTDAQWSASGRVFLIKFKEAETTQFQGAVFAKERTNMEKAFGGDLSTALQAARIQLAGKLQNYRQHPEILINDPKQITILIKGPATRP